MTKKRTVIVLIGIIAALLCALLVLCMPGCQSQPAAPSAAETAPAAESVAPSAPAESEAAEPTAAPVASSAATDVHAVIAETQAMLPVLDAGVRALQGTDNGLYDVADPDFVWSVLYHLCVNGDLQSDLIETNAEAGSMRVPYKLMQELASSCFAEYAELPEPPAGMEVVRYNKDWDAFDLELSDAGETWCVITDVAAGATESSYLVGVACLAQDGDKEELIDTYAFELRPNPYIDGIVGPLFPLSVLGGYSASNVLARITAVEGDAEAPVLTVEHVQVGWEEDAENSEAYVVKITPVERPAETLKLRGMDAAELMMAAALLDGEPAAWKNAAEAFAWLTQNYDRELNGEKLVYQMRVYQGEIYSMAPMASLYFAG